MPGNTVDIRDIIIEDQLGTTIARMFHTWDMLRQPKVRAWEELRRYVYATDTTTTTNSKLPWKNKTTVPKLCQIRDNLNANYMAVLFPKRKNNITWEADDEASNDKDKKDAITSYMTWATQQPSFKNEVGKLVLDYIDYGNCFAMPVWEDQRVELPDRTQVGYVGPALKRISPLDIVFNPIASSFEKSPKIIRSLISLGEVKDLLTRMSTPENVEEYVRLWDYLRSIRNNTQRISGGNLRTYDDFYNVDGFTNYQMYLQSNYVELLTFYGDIYDQKTDIFYKNAQIMVVDRHKIIGIKPNESLFGYPPIFHVGWRTRQDNLWAMGPLDNLIGLQYRIDHVENLKADVFDLLTFPPLKVKGYVEDFEWGPFERIICHDQGDVELLVPPFQVLQANTEIAAYQQQMEEMAGSPKEAMGFRSPGEKTAYEVQRMENAAGRIFNNKSSQFEEQGIEKWMNGMLEVSRRNMSGVQSISVFDDEFKIQTFMELTPNDITGMGRIKPIAARHFAERSEMVQNLNNFFTSAIGQDPDIKTHYSSIKLARMFEEILDLQDYKLVTPYIRLAEHADAQRLAQAAAEQVMIEAGTPAGIRPDDYDHELAGPGGTGAPPPPPGAVPPIGPLAGAPPAGGPPGPVGDPPHGPGFLPTNEMRKG